MFCYVSLGSAPYPELHFLGVVLCHTEAHQGLATGALESQVS